MAFGEHELVARRILGMSWIRMQVAAVEHGEHVCDGKRATDMSLSIRGNGAHGFQADFLGKLFQQEPLRRFQWQMDHSSRFWRK